MTTSPSTPTPGTARPRRSRPSALSRSFWSGCENKDDLASAVAAMSYFDPATAGTLTLTGVPLHPGAAAYYEEMGYAHG